MDRYLFRGKRLDKDEWAVGYYYYLPTTGAKIHVVSGTTPFCLETDIHMVKPHTIGQCVGLKDRNDVLIFEGDIIQIDCYSYEECETTRCGIVEICAYGHGIREIESGEWSYMCDLTGSYTTIYEVLGNRWDNPELLGTKKRIQSGD